MYEGDASCMKATLIRMKATLVSLQSHDQHTFPVFQKPLTEYYRDLQTLYILEPLFIASLKLSKMGSFKAKQNSTLLSMRVHVLTFIQSREAALHSARLVRQALTTRNCVYTQYQ